MLLQIIPRKFDNVRGPNGAHGLFEHGFPRVGYVEQHPQDPVVEPAQERALFTKQEYGGPGPAVDQIVERARMGLDMLSRVTADSDEKLLYLLFAVAGEAPLRGAALPVASVHQPRTGLAIQQVRATADADAVRTEPDEDQADKKIAAEKRTKRPDIIAVGEIFVPNRERRQDQICPG